jgi:hypothetical protein
VTKNLTVDIWRSEFATEMGMGASDVQIRSGGAEVHLTESGKPGDLVGKFTYNTDRSGNVSPNSAHDDVWVKRD